MDIDDHFILIVDSHDIYCVFWSNYSLASAGNFSILLWEAFMIGEVIIVFRFDEDVVEAIQAKIST